MEEIKGTEALEREILEDAAKRSERIVRKAGEEAESLKRRSAQELDAKVAALEREKNDKIAAMRRETLSKLPLEKTRQKAKFIDGALKASVREALDGMDGEKLGAWCLSALKARVPALEGRKVLLRWKGLGRGALSAIEDLLGAAIASSTEDRALTTRGVVLGTADGSMAMALDEALLEDILLDEARGELAQALLPGLFGEGRIS
jgi:vacuolar-type H+-ATPase subunit E/Vma4